tara:strand:- start:43 stop:1374 length:1332 start_codon:yes stop_codon:yes gene_type:complete
MNPKTKLNWKEIESLKASDRKQSKSIGEGVFLIIKPLSKKNPDKGGGKYFIGRYRVPNNKTPKDYQIGVFGKGKNQFLPAEALQEWRDICKWAVDNNQSPKDYKLEQRKQLTSNLYKPTLSKAIERFLQIRRDKVKPTTWREYKRKLNQVVELIDGDMPLEKLETFNDGKLVINRALERLANGGKYDLENRCRFLLHRTFKLAQSLGWMKGANPVETDRDFFITPNTNNHHPTIKWEEVPQFLQAVELNPCNSHKQIVLATKLLLLTFLRTGALTRLEWDWIEEDETDGKVLVIPPTTSGLKRKKGKNDHIPHKVPITPEIDQLLNQAKEYNSWGSFNNESEKYIFLPLRESRFPHLDPSSPNNFIRNLGYKGKFRAHGWRRTALTAGIDVLKTERDVIKRQMGHLPEGKVNKAYDQSERLDERREFLENWGKQLVEMGLKVS